MAITDEYFKFNLNDYFYVKLTDDGFRHWRDYYGKYGKLHDLSYYQLMADEEGYVGFQAHTFIEIFKDFIPCFTRVPFDLNIRIKKSHLQ